MTSPTCVLRERQHRGRISTVAIRRAPPPRSTGVHIPRTFIEMPYGCSNMANRSSITDAIRCRRYLRWWWWKAAGATRHRQHCPHQQPQCTQQSIHTYTIKVATCQQQTINNMSKQEAQEIKMQGKSVSACTLHADVRPLALMLVSIRSDSQAGWDFSPRVHIGVCARTGFDCVPASTYKHFTAHATIECVHIGVNEREQTQTQTRKDTRKDTRTHARTHARTHTHAHTRTHARTRTHMHARTHAHTTSSGGTLCGAALSRTLLSSMV